jgi:dTDP-4-dehydrorhamnose 3,5-epimerase
MNAPLSAPTSAGELAPQDGALAGAARDAQSITSDWQPLQPLIDGVVVREVRNVLKDNGCLTEVWRDDWGLGPAAIAQVFQVVLEPLAVSAWHVHQHATDRLFANRGQLKIVLFDARAGSPTESLVNVFRCGTPRPMLIVVPPGVWHGVQNIGATAAASLLNLPDRAYAYASPDHWRLPSDTDRIPYSFAPGGAVPSGDSERI